MARKDKPEFIPFQQTKPRKPRSDAEHIFMKMFNRLYSTGDKLTYWLNKHYSKKGTVKSSAFLKGEQAVRATAFIQMEDENAPQPRPVHPRHIDYSDLFDQDGNLTK